MANISIPKNIRFCFWGVDLKSLDKEKHKQYIIDQILEYADFDGDKWLKTLYNQKEIIDSIKKSKTISMKTANMYSLIFNIPHEEIYCFMHPFTQKQYRFN